LDKGNFHINSFPLSEKSFTTFFHDHYSSLCFFANRFVKDPQEAEDIVAEVAVKIWEKRETLEHAAALKNYFYTSIRNACLRFLENKERKTIREEDAPYIYPVQSTNTLENIIRTEMFREVERALDHLPPQCRKVFTKLYIEGKTVAQAAKELQLNTSTVKAHKQRGLVILRKKLSSPGIVMLAALVNFWIRSF
jgi:RNA polymerase sigma-70 factor (family 1)